ncbi:MAG: hypothetical protein ACI31M_05030 [Bacilli bacterium]
MKKIFKNSLFTFILGALLFCGIGYVIAEELITAQQVVYKKEDGTLITADQAIEELYGGSGARIYYLGEGTTFDLKSKFPNDYQKFTKNNFIVKFIKSDAFNWTGLRSGGEERTAASDTSVTVSYDSAEGIVTINGTTVTSTHYNGWDPQYYNYTHTVGVYLVDGDIES